MSAPSVLEPRDVHRTHGTGNTAVHALRGVSSGVAPCELVPVMGPSGSGKSTLLISPGAWTGRAGATPSSRVDAAPAGPA